MGVGWGAGGVVAPQNDMKRRRPVGADGGGGASGLGSSWTGGWGAFEASEGDDSVAMMLIIIITSELS